MFVLAFFRRSQEIRSSASRYALHSVPYCGPLYVTSGCSILWVPSLTFSSFFGLRIFYRGLVLSALFLARVYHALPDAWGVSYVDFFWQPCRGLLSRFLLLA